MSVQFWSVSEDCDRRRWVDTTVIDGSQPFILTQFMTIDLTIANNWRIYWTDMKKVAASNLRAVSLFRGLYARVARNLDMDVSYISRIARGERRSKIVEDALNREVIKILKMLKSDSRSPKQTTKNVDQGR